ncbi:MAG TPA: SurA N-terminal domain-containing protein [Solimonas sp.]
MLQTIRDRTSGLVAGFIVAIIAIPFAFFGLEQFGGGSSGDPVVATVGDQKIRESQFRRAYEQRYRQMQALMGENFRADMIDQTLFRQAVLKDMTQEAMLKQYSAEAGYLASDALLFKTISTAPVFQQDGKFNTSAYMNFLANQGESPDAFEKRLRESIAMDQLRASVVDTSFAVPLQVQQSAKLSNQTRNLSYAVFDAARYLSQVTVSDDEVSARFERDKAQYTAPERIKLAYVELAQDAQADAEPPPADVLKVLYDAEKAARFTTLEERKARHILINFGADKSAAKAKAESLAAQLKGGADFATLARQNSDDSGSKADGGDLGWVRRGQMVGKFEEALFDLKPNVVSDPVETEFGWHLVRADEIRPSLIRPFEEPAVQAELVSLYQGRERQRNFQERLEKLEQLAFEKPTELDSVAQALGLTVQTTDWFSRAGGAGVAANEAVRTAAFSQEVLSVGENSKPLTIGDDRVVVVRKSEYEAPRQRSLDEVAEVIRTALRDEQARARAKADADDVVSAAKAGTSLEAAVQAKGAEWRNVGPVRREDSTQDRAVIEALFKLPRPAAGAISYGEASLAGGGIAVLALSGVEESLPESTALGVQQQRVREMLAGGEFLGYRKTVERAIEVDIKQAAQQQPEAVDPES